MNKEIIEKKNFDGGSLKRLRCLLTHSHTMTPFDAPGKQAF